jgi:hypothetical protein
MIATEAELKPMFFFKVLCLILFWAVLINCLTTRHAHAVVPLIPDPGTSIPADQKSYFESCNSGGPVTSTWISPTSAPSSYSMSVVKGTPSVALTFHDAGAVCASDNTGYQYTNKVENAPANVIGLVGNTNTLTWGFGYKTPGYYVHSAVDFTYAPAGGFTTSGVYTVTVWAHSVMAHLSGGVSFYGCVPGEQPTSSVTDYGPCPLYQTDFTIYVNVTDPPPIGVVDGVNCPVVNGWAFDPSLSSKSIYVAMYIDGAGIGWFNANQPSGDQNSPANDVNGAYNITGNHRYGINLPAGYLDGNVHTVNMYAIGIDENGNSNGNNPLIGTKTFTCIGNVSCSVSYPTVVEPGESFNATFTVFNNTSLPVDRGAGWRLGANGAGRDTNTNNYIAATYNDYVRTDWPTNPIPSGGSASYTVTFQAKVPTTHASDFEHNIGNSFAMTGNNLAASSTPYGFQWEVVKEGTGWTGSKCGSSFTVVNKPYLQVFSGDIISGGQVKAFNRGSSNGYVGSGGQLGVFSSSSVTEFASALLRGGAPVVPKGLTFANKTNEYGGGFAAVGAKTFADYWALSSGKTVQAANYHVAGATLNSKSYYFVNGDAYVDGDILYANTGSWNLSTIPSFYLIANGNIYIKSTVTQLSGVYVANGTIYTCTPFGDKTKLNASDVASKCNNNALTVNGAFLADSVKFLRLANTLSQGAAKENPISGTTKAAETFISGPETWLVSPFTNGNDYNSITSLPPVL